jgi:hypothetical protein
MNQKLAQEYDDQIHTHTRANLLVRLEKLLQYSGDDTDSLAFERNFRECQKLYQELPEE